MIGCTWFDEQTLVNKTKMSKFGIDLGESGIFFDGDHNVFLRKTFESSDSRLTDQRVWIIGASSGIGEALSKTLFRTRRRVVLSARRVERLEKLAAAYSK